jgi:hypothetical protein
MTSTSGKVLAAAAIAGGLAMGLSAPAAAQNTGDSVAALSAEARGIIGKFAAKLKGELSDALKSGGPEKAIEVCHTAAPAIAKDASAKGWTVRRTSLKLRNPDNAPDAWEREALAYFDAERAKGADPATLERASITQTGGRKTFRFMKAIPVAAKPCLTCHGTNIKDAVTARLTELYPKDQATGYKEGDIRGAFSLSKPIE